MFSYMEAWENEFAGVRIIWVEMCGIDFWQNHRKRGGFKSLSLTLSVAA